jgi:D-alanyl-D-alanine carboxypeptidase
MDKLMQAVEVKFLNVSGLSNDEKRTARDAFRLFVCAMIDDKVEKGTIEEMTGLIFKRKPNSAWHINPNFGNDELRTFIKLAKREAAKVGVAEIN